MIYRARKGQYSAGQAIGILLLDAMLPLAPGDVANATSYPFPVIYKTVKSASSHRLIFERDPELAQPFIDAGLELIQQGARAITSDCGFMALFQEQLAEALPVPVMLSSLLQVPFIHRMLRKNEKVGILTAQGQNLTERHFRAAGIDASTVVVLGMEETKNFYGAFITETGVLDTDIASDEIVGQAKKLVASDPSIKAILLECSNMPPYAFAVQEAVGLPVFDFNTMINHVFSALEQRPYQGYL